MPLDYRINKPCNVVYVNGTAEVTSADILDLFQELGKNPLYVRPMKALIDLRFAESLLISPTGAFQIAEDRKELHDSSNAERCAFVAPKDNCYGVARILQARIDSKSSPIGVFRDLESAIQWLGLEAAALFVDL